MWPYILKTKFITINSFGFFWVLGIFFSILFLRFLARKEKLSLKNFFEKFIYILTAGLIGSFIFSFLINWSKVKNNPFQFFLGNWLNLSFYGGIIFSLLTFFILFRKDKNKWIWLDLGFLSLMLGNIFGLLGCFLLGTYYGKPTKLFLGINYPKREGTMVKLLNQPLYPTQLFEIFVSLLIIIFILLLIKKIKIKNGLGFILGMSLYSLWRIINDYYFLYQPEKIGLVKINSLIAVLFLGFNFFLWLFLCVKINKGGVYE